MAETLVEVFPAPAGMNRYSNRLRRQAFSVPRACGDEPNPLWLIVM